jgi:hypothetical protein
MSRSLVLIAASVLTLTAGCAAEAQSTDANDSEALNARPDTVTTFTCTSVASTATDDRLKSTRLDISPDATAAGKPTGALVTGFDASLHATSGVGFGVSHVRDTTEDGHHVSEYKIDFGADSILPDETGGTLTVPTVFTQFEKESSAALNVVTLTLTPSNATATYKCKMQTRKIDNGPTPDPVVFQGAAKTTVGKDSCAKTVANATTDALVGAIEDDGVDVPDTFVFTKIDRTSTGYSMTVNGVDVSATVASGCKVKNVDTSAAASLGE